MADHTAQRRVQERLAHYGICAPAEAIRDALRRALPAELRWPDWRLRPHVTLAYGKGFPEPITLPHPVRWGVDSIWLMQSLRGRGQYVPIAQWPLVTLPLIGAILG